MDLTEGGKQHCLQCWSAGDSCTKQLVFFDACEACPTGIRVQPAKTGPPIAERHDGAILKRSEVPLPSIYT